MLSGCQFVTRGTHPSRSLHSAAQGSLESHPIPFWACHGQLTVNSPRPSGVPDHVKYHDCQSVVDSYARTLSALSARHKHWNNWMWVCVYHSMPGTRIGHLLQWPAASTYVGFEQPSPDDPSFGKPFAWKCPLDTAESVPIRGSMYPL